VVAGESYCIICFAIALAYTMSMRASLTASSHFMPSYSFRSDYLSIRSQCDDWSRRVAVAA